MFMNTIPLITALTIPRRILPRYAANCDSSAVPPEFRPCRYSLLKLCWYGLLAMLFTSNSVLSSSNLHQCSASPHMCMLWLSIILSKWVLDILYPLMFQYRRFMSSCSPFSGLSIDTASSLLIRFEECPFTLYSSNGALSVFSTMGMWSVSGN